MQLTDTEIFALANDKLGEADVDFAGYSGGGIHVVGGTESIKKVTKAVHKAYILPQLYDSIDHLSKELKLAQAERNRLREEAPRLRAETIRLGNELTAMEMAAKSRMHLDALVAKGGIVHVLLGLGCIADENAQICRSNHEPHSVSDRWQKLGSLLGRTARENVDLEDVTP